MRVYSILFKENGKPYYFKSDEIYEVNTYVIVETEKGEQYGKIVETNIENNKVNLDDLKDILRECTESDQKTYTKNLKDADVALKKCRKIVDDLKLNMNIISAAYTFDRKQLLFNFVSDERVDFRELAKKLAGMYHTRIELRQIGARDKAKEFGGVGVCGRRICCNDFLKHIDAVTMNMAKNQNLALNPNKINGVCGRLLCCLAYEDEQYIECSKTMPSVGQTVNTKKGSGQVVSVDILNQKYKVMINGNKEEIVLGTCEKLRH